MNLYPTMPVIYILATMIPSIAILLYSYRKIMISKIAVEKIFNPKIKNGSGAPLPFMEFSMGTSMFIMALMSIILCISSLNDIYQTSFNKLSLSNLDPTQTIIGIMGIIIIIIMMKGR